MKPWTTSAPSTENGFLFMVAMHMQEKVATFVNEFGYQGMEFGTHIKKKRSPFCECANSSLCQQPTGERERERKTDSFQIRYIFIIHVYSYFY